MSRKQWLLIQGKLSMKYIEYLEIIKCVVGLEHKVVGENNQLGNKRRNGDLLRSLGSFVCKMLLPNMFSSIQVVTSSY